MLLLRLADFTGRQDLREKAERTLKAFGEPLESAPLSHTYMLCALGFWFGSKEIVVAGGGTGATGLVDEIHRRFLPDKVLALASPDLPEISSLIEGKGEIGGRPAVYICENFACKSPATDLESLKRQLDA